MDRICTLAYLATLALGLCEAGTGVGRVIKEQFIENKMPRPCLNNVCNGICPLIPSPVESLEPTPPIPSSPLAGSRLVHLFCSASIGLSLHALTAYVTPL